MKLSTEQSWRNVSVLILYNNEGKMLLEYRAKERERYPNVWALFGGAIEVGETKEDALIREVKEELNYDVRNPIYLCSQKLPKGEKHVFVEEYDEKQKITLDPNESQKYGWFTLEEALDLDAIPHDFDPLSRAWEYIKHNRK